MGDKVSIILLGGSREVGERNCYLIVCEVHGEYHAVMLDCGQRIPGSSEDGHGEEREELSDDFFPNFGPLFERGIIVDALVVSHAHLDHVGGVHRFYRLYREQYPDRELPPLMATNFAERVIKKIVYNGAWFDRNTPKPSMVCDLARYVWLVGGFRISSFPVIHNTPESRGICVRVGGNSIVYTGDFKTQGLASEMEGLESALRACAGADVVLMDSTNAHKTGFTAPESEALDAIGSVMREYRDGRVVVATFSSHIERLRGIMNIAHSQGRQVLVSGGSMTKYLAAARIFQQHGEHGDYMWYGKDSKTGLMPNLPLPANALILLTGAQGERGAALDKIRGGLLPLPFGSNDALIIAADTIPRPEIEDNVRAMVRALSPMVPNLFIANNTANSGEQGLNRGPFHSSGHGRAGDIGLILNTLQAGVCIPVHAPMGRRALVAGLVPQGTECVLLEEGDEHEI